MAMSLDMFALLDLERVFDNVANGRTKRAYFCPSLVGMKNRKLMNSSKFSRILVRIRY